jgi:hypothetical protein
MRQKRGNKQNKSIAGGVKWGGGNVLTQHRNKLFTRSNEIIIEKQD